MTIRHAILFLCVLCATGSWSQTDIGYINVSVVKHEYQGSARGIGDTVTFYIDSIPIQRGLSNETQKARREERFKNHLSLKPNIRLNNYVLGFRLSKDSEKTVNLVPLVDLGIQYNTNLTRLNHRNGMGFLLEARPIKKSYVRIGGLVNISNAENLNLSNINLTDIGELQKLWVMPMTRLAYTPNEVFCFQAGYDRNFIGSGRRSLFLSDYGKPMPFGQIRAKFWHMEYSINYQFLSENIM
mgnify:CR=1 FL=1